jgi:hypothetical protein
MDLADRIMGEEVREQKRKMMNSNSTMNTQTHTQIQA